MVQQETDKGNGDQMEFMKNLTLVSVALRSLVTTGLLLGGLGVGLVAGGISRAEAAADGEKALWVGGAGGLMVPNKSGTTARTMLGITAGAKIGTELGLGAYYFTSQKDEGGVVGKFDNDYYGVEGTYHFEGEAKGAYFGVRLGITKMDFGATPNQVSASPFHAGFIAGYNHWVTDFLSVGGDIGFYSVSKGEATSQATGTTVTVDSYSALNFLATLKLWL